MQTLCNDAPHFEGFGGIYCSAVHPSAVKAWPLHARMTLNYATVTGMIKLALSDDRAGSATRREVMELFLGDHPAGSFTATIPCRWDLRHGLRSASTPDPLGRVSLRLHCDRRGCFDRPLHGPSGHIGNAIFGADLTEAALARTEGNANGVRKVTALMASTSAGARGGHIWSADPGESARKPPPPSFTSEDPAQPASPSARLVVRVRSGRLRRSCAP